MTRDPARNREPAPDLEPAGSRAGPSGCIPNIGPDGRRRRLVLAAVGLAFAVATLAAVLAVGAGRPWRLAAFPFFWLGFLGLFQATGRT